MSLTAAQKTSLANERNALGTYLYLFPFTTLIAAVVAGLALDGNSYGGEVSAFFLFVIALWFNQRRVESRKIIDCLEIQDD